MPRSGNGEPLEEDGGVSFGSVSAKSLTMLVSPFVIVDSKACSLGVEAFKAFSFTWRVSIDSSLESLQKEGFWSKTSTTHKTHIR
jgi:hypothetical protein